MGLAGKLKAGGYGGAPPQGGAPPTAPSAPPAPQSFNGGFQQQSFGGQQQQQQKPQPAYPAPAQNGFGGNQGNMQGGNQQGSQFGNQNGSGSQYGQPGAQGQQFGQPGGQGQQFGQPGGQFGHQGNFQGNQYGNQNGQQSNQYGQASGYGGSQASQYLQQHNQAPPYSQGYGQGYGQGQGQNQGGNSQMQQTMAQGQTTGVLMKLQSIVQVNQLHRFYPPQAIQALAQRIEQSVDFNALAARWGMPKELAMDLACLALYDIVILADDSSSMSFEEQGERIEDLKIVLSKVAEVATLFDQDGILIRFLNSNVQGNGVRNAQEAEAIVKQVRFQGLTPLAGAMNGHVLEPVVFNLAQSGQLQKPVLVITITDGEPSDSPRDAVLQVIANARRRLAPQYGPKALAFQFAQVGRDQRAQHFLEKLDKHPEVGDIIDCTSYYELEAEEFKRKGIDMTVEIWLVKLMVGAVDPSYDAEDEG